MKSSLMERAADPLFIAHLRRHGLKRRKRSAADYRSILNDRHAGMTWAAMGKKLGVSRSMACVLFHQATAMKQAGLLE
jgi:hypothetical protein